MDNNQLAELLSTYDGIWLGSCKAAKALRLFPYDQHLVNVNGQEMVLLTTLDMEDVTGVKPTFEMIAVAVGDKKRPPVPESVQKIVDEIDFRFMTMSGA
jgi:hypothetical protein